MWHPHRTPLRKYKKQTPAAGDAAPPDDEPAIDDGEVPAPRPLEKLAPMASGTISLKDASQVLTDDDKQRFQEDLHTPWEEGGAGGGAPPGRRRIALAFLALAGVALVVFLVTRRGGDEPPGAPDTAAPDTVPYIPQAELREGIAEAVRVLSTSRDPEEVLGVVRDPEGVAARVRARYAGSPPPAREIAGVELAPNSSLFSSEDSVLLKAVVQFADFDTRNAVVEWRDGRALVDWEHWVHYQPLPVEAFLAGRPVPEGAAPEFRLAARWAAAFEPSGRFREERHRCLKLRDPRVNGDEFTAYLRRGTAAEQKLVDLLQGGAERAVMLELALADGEVEVTRWVVAGWCRDRW